MIKGSKIKKIAVAVSGGVDSGVALALLKDEGHDLIAVFTDHFGCSNNSNKSSCCSIVYEKTARENAEFLNVPFYKMDFIGDFNKRIIEPFIDYYRRGLTPNPCIWCNSRIRFTLLKEKMEKIGYNYLATGHYARIDGGKLKKGRDKKKDQSYFLYNVPKEHLSSVIFPLGEILKDEVCDLAEKKNLPVRKSNESQDCCMLMEDSLESFMKEKIKLERGDIVDLSGNKLGEHPGYQNFTRGQRKGLGGLGKRYYVYEIIPDKNRIIVAGRDKLMTDVVRFKIDDTFDVTFKEKDIFKAKLRYTQAGSDCRIEKLNLKNNICTIKFNEKQFSPTPGQIAVLYNDDEIAGGGEILK